MSTTWKKVGSMFPELVSRVSGNGKEEIGELYCIEKIMRLGALRATYEYNIFHWFESGEWKADVVSPHGWHDLGNDELKRLLRELKTVEL